MQNRTSEIIFGLNAAELIFYGTMALCAAVMLIYYIKKEKPVKTAVLGMLSGGVTLMAANFFGSEIGLAIPVNWFTTFTALTLGAPGVAAMCILQVIL